MKKLRHSQIKKQNLLLVDLMHKNHKVSPSDRKENILYGIVSHMKNTEHW